MICILTLFVRRSPIGINGYPFDLFLLCPKLCSVHFLPSRISGRWLEWLQRASFSRSDASFSEHLDSFLLLASFFQPLSLSYRILFVRLHIRLFMSWGMPRLSHHLRLESQLILVLLIFIVLFCFVRASSRLLLLWKFVQMLRSLGAASVLLVHLRYRDIAWILKCWRRLTRRLSLWDSQGYSWMCSDSLWFKGALLHSFFLNYFASLFSPDLLIGSAICKPIKSIYFVLAWSIKQRFNLKLRIYRLIWLYLDLCYLLPVLSSYSWWILVELRFELKFTLFSLEELLVLQDSSQKLKSIEIEDVEMFLNLRKLLWSNQHSLLFQVKIFILLLLF